MAWARPKPFCGRPTLKGFSKGKAVPEGPSSQALAQAPRKAEGRSRRAMLELPRAFAPAKLSRRKGDPLNLQRIPHGGGFAVESREPPCRGPLHKARFPRHSPGLQSSKPSIPQGYRYAGVFLRPSRGKGEGTPQPGRRSGQGSLRRAVAILGKLGGASG